MTPNTKPHVRFAVDLETLALSSDCAVLSIGCAVVPTREDFRKWVQDGLSFYQMRAMLVTKQWKLSLAAQVAKHKRKINIQTLYWHRGIEGDLARNAIDHMTLQLAGYDAAKIAADARNSGISIGDMDLWDPKDALFDFAVFLGEHTAGEPFEVWGQGYGFDMNILQSLADSFAADSITAQRWACDTLPYFTQRDSRTLFKLFDGDVRKETRAEGADTAHDAEQDAIDQALALARVLDVMEVA